MILKCIRTSSDGNCYILKKGKNRLVLDCGISIKELKKALDYDINNVAILITHKHKDHSMCADQAENIGIKVVKAWDYFKDEKTVFNVLDWNVRIIDMTDLNGHWTHTNADGSECPCFGFLISNDEMGRMLYITDTSIVKYRFKNINHILIGCNYQKRFVNVEESVKNSHVFAGHMELETCKEFIRQNDSEYLQNVILCHISKKNSNVREMVNEVKKSLKSQYFTHVYYAIPGKEWDLRNGNDCPF